MWASWIPTNRQCGREKLRICYALPWESAPSRSFSLKDAIEIAPANSASRRIDVPETPQYLDLFAPTPNLALFPDDRRPTATRQLFGLSKGEILF